MEAGLRTVLKLLGEAPEDEGDADEDEDDDEEADTRLWSAAPEGDDPTGFRDFSAEEIQSLSVCAICSGRVAAGIPNWRP